MTIPGSPVTNRRTGHANSVGGYANSGTHIGDVNLHTGVPVRTWYREQVRRIAPVELVDRQTELTELEKFCTDPATRGRYSWWRAEAWAGKSALMSWFILNPPQNVRVVSFFITARLASQNDRVAFADNVLEQLAAILGEPLPQTTDSTRDVHLLGMLHAAAERCRERGEEFVLVVDGLDEDRGVTTGRNAHSVAALLPIELPAGLRVIVTGRPHPPVPEDVPEHHPLRDPRIVRRLSTAVAAKVVRADMLRELRELLDGTADEQALLGFLTVAGGGLTALDLSDLTGKPSWRVEEHLRTVAGRSFTRRGGYWQPDFSPEAYLLGHEELQSASEEQLGPERLAAFRSRLHLWADSYRERGWPSDTPEYLLRGYFQILDNVDDIQRMVRLGTDHLRHGRMLDASGGDAAALAEIATTQDALLLAEEVDLKSMACLAMHRDYLTERNVDIPTDLSAVWAALGQPARAEALTKSISDVSIRCNAELRVMKVLARNGNASAAKQCVRRLLMNIAAVSDSEHRAEMATAAIDLAFDLGRSDWAQNFMAAAGDESLLRAVNRSEALYGPVEGLEGYLESVAPLHVRATELSEQVNVVLERVEPVPGVPAITVKIMSEWITDSALPSETKIQLALAARRLIDDRRPTDALVAAEADEEVLASVALAACTAGYLDAGALLARHIENPSRRVEAVTSLATACARAGDVDGAETLLSVCGDSEYRAEATMSLALVLAETGVGERALDLMLQRQFLIEDVITEDGHTELKSKAAQAWAALGDFDQAARVARSISGANDLASVFTAMAARVIAKGDFDVARGFATDAETFARMSVTTTTRVQGFTALAQAFATAGDFPRAEAVAGIAVPPDGEPSTREHLAKTFVELGEHERATTIAHGFPPLVRDHVLVELVTSVDSDADLIWAEKIAKSVSTEPARVRALAHCARLAVACDDLDRAVAIMHAIPDAGVRVEVAGVVLRELAGRRDLDRIQAVIDWAESRLSMNVSAGERWAAEQLLGSALTARGDFEAASFPSSVTGTNRSAFTVAAVAMAAFAGQEDQSHRILERIDSPVARQQALGEMVNAAIFRRSFIRANELVDRLDAEDLRDRMRIEIAAAAAADDHADIAGSVTNQICDAGHRGWALAASAATGFVLPSSEEVDKAVSAVADLGDRLELLAAFVDVLSSVGRVAPAIELIRSTSEPEHRGLVWSVLAENSDGDSARSAAALSFRWGRWTTAMSTLARLEPTALRGVEKEFFVLNPDSAAQLEPAALP